MKKLFIWIGIIVVILVIAVVVKRLNTKQGIKVSVEKPARRNINETVSANGKIQPENEIKISSDISGEITELHVKDGDFVHKGQLLAKINPQIYQSQLERIAASVDQARAQLANAKASKAQADARMIEAESSYKRSKTLYDQKVISQSEYESAKSAYDVAKAQQEAAVQSVKSAEYSITSAQASLKEATDNLGKTSIFAPKDGTIYGLKVEQGERVVGTLQMAGTEMMRIADLNYMIAMVDVNENDIVRVHRGDTSTIEVDAYPKRKFKGIVYELSNAAKSGLAASTDQATNFEVKVRIISESYADLKSKLAGNESPFRAGMNASVEIQTNRKENVMSVPLESVTTRLKNEKDKTKKDKEGEEGKAASKDDMETLLFYVDKDNKARKMTVKSGMQDDKYIEIETPVDTSLQVITAPYSAVSKTLKDGDQVIITDKSKLFEK
jgi:HlyD family secretion protein